ncbi:hypothetical protein ERO13_A07G108000v2 [Gossypium hirsutum]|uniref:Uncharacterized protein n=3 Tax=Gossypium TaxID=3633 RepID=A0A5J5V2V7_GOSBA|nr:hypothetical protein ES319_A07G118000v1 [Gossypium barbadense]KAG4191648.1 hypothetical protein ERO13_A07G108000v2 [Gossypium hirsutum]TYH09798.1 hypothetical protein ES288_A07G126000v1 [Gossypium darwinii]TYI18888.1 hypothetical protein ES332_A07G125300v1 [Gossypium tomentosum]
MALFHFAIKIKEKKHNGNLPYIIAKQISIVRASTWRHRRTTITLGGRPCVEESQSEARGVYGVEKPFVDVERGARRSRCGAWRLAAEVSSV